MDISSILIYIFVLVVDITLITKDVRNKLIIAGKNKYKIIVPAMIAAFIIITLVTKEFKAENIIIGIELIPLAFVGNKSGISKNGLIMNSYITTWENIKNYSLEEKGDKFIVNYKTEKGNRKIYFKVDKKDEVKNYLSSIRKLKYVRK